MSNIITLDGKDLVLGEEPKYFMKNGIWWIEINKGREGCPSTVAADLILRKIIRMDL